MLWSTYKYHCKNLEPLIGIEPMTFRHRTLYQPALLKIWSR